MVEDDDDEDDHGYRHMQGGCGCNECAHGYLALDERSYGADGGYFYDHEGHCFDAWGRFIAPPPEPCQEVRFALPPPRPAPEERGRRSYTRMTSPPRDDLGDDDYYWSDGPSGPVRYSRQLLHPICDESGRRPRVGVERYRCG